MNRREFLKASAVITIVIATGFVKANARENEPVKTSTGWDIGWDIGGWNIATSDRTKNKTDHRNYIPLVF